MGSTGTVVPLLSFRLRSVFSSAPLIPAHPPTPRRERTRVVSRARIPKAGVGRVGSDWEDGRLVSESFALS